MSEETQEHEGTWSGLKKTIVGTLATVVTAGGAWLGSTLFGSGDDAAPVAAPAPVINIQNNNTQQQSNGGGKTVIIKEKEAAAKPVTPRKKTEQEQLEEAPAW